MRPIKGYSQKLSKFVMKKLRVFLITFIALALSAEGSATPIKNSVCQVFIHDNEIKVWADLVWPFPDSMFGPKRYRYKINCSKLKDSFSCLGASLRIKQLEKGDDLTHLDLDIVRDVTASVEGTDVRHFTLRWRDFGGDVYLDFDTGGTAINGTIRSLSLGKSPLRSSCECYEIEKAAQALK